ncbi:hypothetical protein [Streptomyces sp. NPDC088785]|uniref:hypothetical protein n=1 Tax=Streptomyces sp. NPDC088785 TaxID=3365897 RepID=UPI003802AD05
MDRSKCLLLAGATAVSLIVGPAAGLAAATPQTPAAAFAAPRPTLTARATASSVKLWQEFRIYGQSSHMRAGTRVTLQQKQGRVWKYLPVSMNTTRTGAYNLRVKLGLKGPNQLRMVGGSAISPVVRVDVR